MEMRDGQRMDAALVQTELLQTFSERLSPRHLVGAQSMSRSFPPPRWHRRSPQGGVLKGSGAGMRWIPSPRDRGWGHRVHPWSTGSLIPRVMSSVTVNRLGARIVDLASHLDDPEALDVGDGC
jgi:hypothetical protein